MDAGVGLSNGAVAGHIKWAGALNAWIHRVNIELVGKPVNGITLIHHICPYSSA